VHKPLFVYLQQHHWQVGSALKYFTILKTHYGGMTLESKKAVAVLGDFKTDIRKLQPALIFVRGDWLQYYKVALMYDIPYILIEQDVHSLRTKLKKRQLAMEREMVDEAAGIIFTSEDHLAYCKQMNYNVDNSVVIHLRPLKEQLAWAKLSPLEGKHLVYAGGLVTHAGGSYGYRGYERIFKAFMEAGWTVHVYANKNQYATVRKYGALGCVQHGWKSYPELLQEMSQYTAGLQAYAKVGVCERQFAYTQTCRPNKTWDYLAAGIPTIGLYHGNCAKIYVDGGWGVTIPDIEKSTLENIELPSFPDSLRYEQVMEKDLHLFDEVITKALAKEKKSTKTGKIELVQEEGEEEDMADASKLWYRLKDPVVENGRLLHGRGKRIPMNEAIRLGLVKKETLVKKELKKRAERKKAEKKKAVKKEKKIETKPLVEEEGKFKTFKKEKVEKVEELAHTLSVDVIDKKKEDEN
jgi:hypothetical protein